jgi:hypothetical protein
MKRIVKVVGLALGLVAPVLAGSVVIAGPASAVSPAVCTSWDNGFSFRSTVAQRTPTGLYSAWVFPNHGSVTITYQQTASYQNNVSTTATVTTEAGLIFASASASIGVTVGQSWTESKSWSYAATVAQSSTYEYRLHLYHQSYNFQVMKYSSRVCNGVTQKQNQWSSWQTVSHAPVRGASGDVWVIDRQLA